MKKRSDLYSWLGLAQRAGKLISGDGTLEASLRKGEGYLLVIAQDCGKNNFEKYIYLAGREHIPYFFFGTKEELGLALGKSQRVAVLVMDEGLAREVVKRKSE